MKKLKSIPTGIKATISFVLANSITQGLTLLVTPIFVRIMTTDEIGSITNFNSWYTIIGIVVNMMLYANSYVLAMNEYSQERDQYTSCTLFISMFSTAIFALFCFLFKDYFIKILNMNDELIILMICAFMFLPATNMWLARQRFEYKYISVLTVSSIIAISSTLLSVLAVIASKNIGGNAVNARLIATYSVQIIIGLVFSVIIFTRGRTIIKGEYIKFIIFVNSPMIIHSLSKNILDVSDRIMIASLVGKSEAGIYGTLYSICTLIMILWNAINTAITPYVFSKLNEIENEEESIKRFMDVLLIIFFGLSLIFVLIAPEFISIFTTSIYADEIHIVPPIVCGCFVTSVYSLVGNILLFNKKTISIMGATLIASVVNVALNRLLIPICGYQIAAYTTIIGYCCLTIALFIATRRINNKTSRAFDFKFSILLIISNIVLNVIIVNVYNSVIIRYGIIFILIAMTVMMRNKIFSVIKIVTKKNG